MAEETEQKILSAARQVFMNQGYDGARMQEIADVALVNKSMLHYYFSSKKQLFNRVYREAIARLLPQLIELLNADLVLEEKIPRLVRRYVKMLRKHPRLPSFVLQEINQNPEELLGFIKGLEIGKPDKFLKQVSRAQQEGTINEIEPEQLLVNIISLCVFPFAARPMIQYIIDLDDQKFEAFIEKRTQSLSPFILNAIQ